MPISTSEGATGATLVWRRHGRYQVTAVIKATFALVPGGVMTAVTPEPIADDEQEDSAGLRTAGDLVPFRGQADVLVTGHTFVPRSAAATEVPVRLSLLRDGVAVLDKSLSLQVPARSHPGSVRLFGLGPLSRHWPVRSQLLGSHDPRLFEGASIELPATFDESYFQAAPVDQRLDSLRGDDWIAIDGVRPKGARIETRLPDMRAAARVHDAASERQGGRPLHLVLDTLHVDLDLMVCNVIWRGVAAVARAADLASMHVSATVEPASEPDAPVEASPDSQIIELANEDVFDSTLNLGPGEALLEVTLPPPTPPAPPTPAPPPPPESEPGFARARVTGQPSLPSGPARLAEMPLPPLKRPPPPPRPPPPRPPPQRGVPWAPAEPPAEPVAAIELESMDLAEEHEHPLGSTAALSPDAVMKILAAKATPFGAGADGTPAPARARAAPFVARKPQPDEHTAILPAHPLSKTATLGPRKRQPDEHTAVLAIHPLETTEPLGPDEVRKILADKVTPFAPAAAPPTPSFATLPLMAPLEPVLAAPATSFATPALTAPPAPPATAKATPALMAPIEPMVTAPATSFSTPPLTTPLRALAARSPPVRRSFAVSAGELTFGAHFLAAMEQARLNPNDERDGPAAD